MSPSLPLRRSRVRSVAFVVLATCLLPSPVLGAGTVIDDANVRARDAGPALGLGYSRASGQLLYNCLFSTETREPSYDYVTTVTEINSQATIEKDLYRLSGSLSYYNIYRAIYGDYVDRPMGENREPHHVVFNLDINKYYNAIGTSTLVEAAKSYFDVGDFVGFIQSCGPTFVRAIQRRSEFTVKFLYSTDIGGGGANVGGSSRRYNDIILDHLQQVGDSVGTLHSNQFDNSIIFTAETFSYGMGIVSGHDSTVGPVLHSWDSLKHAFNYAFRAMTAPDAGLVVAMEVVPWTTHAEFQDMAGLNKAVKYTKLLTNSTNATDTTAAANATVVLDLPVHRKFFNFFVNAEHISQIDQFVKQRLLETSLLQRCITRLHSFKSYMDDLPLKPHVDIGSMNQVAENLEFYQRITVDQLRRQLNRVVNTTDGRQQEYLQARNTEIYDYVNNYYGPCMDVLSEDAFDLDGNAIFAAQYVDMPACADLTCKMSDAVWVADATGGGHCVSAIQDNMVTVSDEEYDLVRLAETWCSPEIQKTET